MPIKKPNADTADNTARTSSRASVALRSDTISSSSSIRRNSSAAAVSPLRRRRSNSYIDSFVRRGEIDVTAINAKVIITNKIAKNNRIHILYRKPAWLASS